jgi:hypothetical protein
LRLVGHDGIDGADEAGYKGEESEYNGDPAYVKIESF